MQPTIEMPPRLSNGVHCTGWVSDYLEGVQNDQAIRHPCNGKGGTGTGTAMNSATCSITVGDRGAVGDGRDHAGAAPLNRTTWLSASQPRVWHGIP